MKVSIVIPTYNSENTIIPILLTLREQDYPRFEVIIVDNLSSDSTVYKIKEFHSRTPKEMELKLIQNKTHTKLSQALNQGIKKADGEIIITLHDDCIPTTTTWISDLVGTFQTDSKIGLVSSDYVVDFDSLSLTNKLFTYAYWLGEHKRFSKPEGIEDVKLIAGKCDAYRRDVLDKVGGFDELFKSANEDMDISHKIKNAGYRIVINHKCKVEHRFWAAEREKTLLDHLRKPLQLTEQNINIFFRYGESYKLDAFLAELSILIGLVAPKALEILYVVSFLLSRIFGMYGLAFWIANLFFPLPYFGVVVGLSYLILKNLAKSTKYYFRYKKFDLILPIATFGLAWDLVAGLGWFKGTILFAYGQISKVFK